MDAKPGDSIRETSGRRSEVNLRHIFLSLAFITLFTANSFAQKAQPILVDVVAGANASRDFPRPRIVWQGDPVANLAIYELERHAFELLNAERSSKGLSALVWSDKVAELARVHSRSMADESFFGHRGTDGSMVDDRADRLGLGGWLAIGENIAYMRGYDRPAEMAVEKWMQSTSHRNNMLSPRWSESAIGIAAAADGTYYFTQVFLLRKH